MDSQDSPPPPPLAGWIRTFWRLRGHGLGQQPVVPDGRMEIVIHLADCFHQIDASGNSSAQDEVMLAGQLTAPLLLAAGASADGIGSRFRTAGARALLGIPLELSVIHAAEQNQEYQRNRHEARQHPEQESCAQAAVDPVKTRNANGLLQRGGLA